LKAEATTNLFAESLFDKVFERVFSLPADDPICFFAVEINNNRRRAGNFALNGY
jgi:hypothetical protein